MIEKSTKILSNIIAIQIIVIAVLLCVICIPEIPTDTEVESWNASKIVNTCIIENETVYILENKCIVYFGNTGLSQNYTSYKIGDMLAYPESRVLGVIH